jgi:hypothetical protein
MGGPWREPETYRQSTRPSKGLAPSQAEAQAATRPDWMTRFVLAYVAAVAGSLAMMVWALQNGW